MYVNSTEHKEVNSQLIDLNAMNQASDEDSDKAAWLLSCVGKDRDITGLAGSVQAILIMLRYRTYRNYTSPLWLFTRLAEKSTPLLHLLACMLRR